MDNRRLYETSVNSALGKIAAHVPEDIVARFAGVSGMDRDDFRPIPPGPSGYRECSGREQRDGP